MSRHRLEPPRAVRPRYGRVAAAGLSLAVTMVALLGGLGLIPLDSPGSDPATVAARGTSGQPDTTVAAGAAGTTTGVTSEPSRAEDQRNASAALEQVAAAVPEVGTSTLPADSGTGRRVVFSIGSQRVWLVATDGTVASTYPVSGSVTDNLDPGRYDVYSRSRWAVGVEDSGVMQYFVRFAHGAHAAIGFHSIPTKNGTPLQTVAQLGTPQSHGCIRQKLVDAQRMWAFAKVGTDVVVVA
jgi:lipoprotein-anchoring transpeptidase ErfK/SrfK